LCLFCVSMC
jgi:hypothetical protein